MDLIELIEKRIKQGNETLERLSTINVDGISKLRKKIKQEVNFLEKCQEADNLKEEHLICSNLTHLEAVAAQLIKHENFCLSIMNNKTLKKKDGTAKKICIDLVLHNGSVWMKVIARNRKALTLVSNGDCSFGQKSIIDQAYEFIECSTQHFHYFKAPKVVFFFANGIEECLAEDLRNIGINVEKNLEIVNSNELFFNRSEKIFVATSIKMPDVKNATLINEINCKKLNLGVTTMIAYVSALTNGGSNCNFESEILKKHAEWEKINPVKPILDKLFEGRELYCCRTAADSFRNILNVLGGKNECERGKELLKRMKVIEDHPFPHLKSGGKIKERSLAIFGTGKYLKAITVTANHAFIRSAMNKGVHFEVFLHESRALTEGKQFPS